MSHIQARLRAMKEAELRTSVLIPLFTAMGYQDVFHYHGGSQEQGKDIVMWQPDTFRGRTNYAVVVKATKITGQAEGRSSAADVVFQIRQCLGRPYQDPRTLEERSVHRCIVVSNQEILKEALISIGSVASPANIQSLVDFVDIYKLAELVERYLPEKTALQALLDVHSVMDSASPHWRITATSTGGQILLGLEAKHPDAEVVDPLVIHGKFRFPDTEEGLAVAEAVKAHFADGTPVSIHHAFIEELNVPAFLRPFIDLDASEYSIAIGPTQLSDPLLVKLRAVPYVGEPAELRSIELRGVAVGFRSLKLSNEHQNIPWHFTFEVDLEKRAMKVHYKTELVDVNVKRELETLLFFHSLRNGGLLEVVSEDADITIFGGPIPSGVLWTPSSGWVDFVKKVAEIQRLTRVPLAIPMREITRDELELVDALVQKLSRGSYDAGHLKEVTVPLSREGASQVYSILSDQSTTTLTIVVEDDAAELFGTQIHLGPAKVIIETVGILPEDMELLRDILDQENSQAREFPVRFVSPTGNASVRYEYERWKPHI